MRRNLLSFLLTITAAIAFFASGAAGQPTTQDPPGRPRQTKPPPKPAPEPVEQPLLTTPIQEQDEAMRRAITNLSTQIGLLADEMRNLRRETERNSWIMELLLNEDRLAKVEDKIQDANNDKAQLDARELDIQLRLKNIQRELILRGGVRRDESEAAIRSEFQRALDDIRSQQVINQQRIADLNGQAARFRARAEALRKKLEFIDEKNEKEEK